MGPFVTARIVWGALLAALPAYLVSLVLVLRQPGAGPVADVGTMRSALVAVSVAVVVVVLFLRRRLPSVDGDPTRAATSSPTEAFTTYVVCWALSESIALYGMVLGFLSRTVDEALPFFATGALLLLWQRPRRAHLGG